MMYNDLLSMGRHFFCDAFDLVNLFCIIVATNFNARLLFDSKLR